MLLLKKNQGKEPQVKRSSSVSDLLFITVAELEFIKKKIHEELAKESVHNARILFVNIQVVRIFHADTDLASDAAMLLDQFYSISDFC